MSRCSKNPHDEQKIDCELNRQKRAQSSTMLARVMGGEIPGNANGIARSLDEGWHYRPDWRSATVEAYLVDKQMEQPPLETLKEEEDCFVRQFYLFRRCGRCLEQSAFKWAYACVVNNPATAAASLVKALTVARVPVNEIAGKLRTSRKNIVVYQRLYFDIGRYLDEQAWLASIIFAPSQNPQDPVEFRERHWMTAAFVRGERGLGQAFTPKVALSPEERDELTSQIRSILTSRAFEFISAFRTGLIPPGSEDFERFTEMLDVTSRQPLANDDGEAYARMLDSVNSLVDAARKAAEDPENPNNLELQKIFAVDGSDATTTPQKVLSW
jgi:hypothetical protein